MKTDPATGSAEAIGRLFNALFLTYELKQKEQEVAHIFQGAGTRWAAEVVRPEHPAYGLFALVEDKVAGVCGGCADVFGAATAAGAKLVRDADVPGTSGVIDLSRYLDDGYRLLTS